MTEETNLLLLVGKVIGTLDSLKEVVERQNETLLRSLEKQDLRMDEHEEQDSLLYKSVATLSEWKNGVNGEPGAQKILNDYQTKKGYAVGFMGCVALICGAAGTKIMHWLDVAATSLSGGK